MKTAAELALAESYASAKPKLPGDGKVVALREAAFRRFDAQGLPHRRVEEWKYTDLRALMREAKPLAGAARRRRQGARQDGRAVCSATWMRAAWCSSTARSCRSCPISTELEAGPRHPLDGAGAGRRRSAGRGASRQGRAGRRRRRGGAQHRADERRRGDPRRGRRDGRAADPSGVRRDRRQAGLGLHALAGGDREGRARHAGRKPRGPPARASGQHRARAGRRRRGPCRPHQDHRRRRAAWSMSRR